MFRSRPDAGGVADERNGLTSLDDNNNTATLIKNFHGIMRPLLVGPHLSAGDTHTRCFFIPPPPQKQLLSADFTTATIYLQNGGSAGSSRLLGQALRHRRSSRYESLARTWRSARGRP